MSRNALDRNLFDLTGKIAVVTGAAGIQGVRVSRGLAAFGARLACVDIAVDAVNRLAKEIKDEYGTDAVGIHCNVSNASDVASMVDKVCKLFGGIHVLHNNAAAKTRDLRAFFAPFEEFSLEAWREVMAVNLDGMFLVAQAVGRQMVRQSLGGSIIQTASTYGVVGPDQRIYEGMSYDGRRMNSPAVYSASKAAVIGLTRYLATYWADKGIRVNSLTPGGIDDENSKADPSFAAVYASRVPLGRMAVADDMVGAVVFLASDAASYVTGHNLVVDGGWTAW